MPLSDIPTVQLWRRRDRSYSVACEIISAHWVLKYIHCRYSEQDQGNSAESNNSQLSIINYPNDTVGV